MFKVARQAQSLFKFQVRYFSSSPVHAPYCVIGSGAAGVNVTAQLINAGVLKNHIRVFDPSKYHHYQPGWTIVGGGLAPPEKFISSNDQMLRPGVSWVDLAVEDIDPDKNIIETEDGSKFSYGTSYNSCRNSKPLR